ncbi:MAG: hypothetical protein P8123_05425, partial [bacterium]
ISKNISFFFILFLIGFYAMRILEIGQGLKKSHDKLDALTVNLEQLNVSQEVVIKDIKAISENQSRSQNYLRALHSIGNLDEGSTFRNLLSVELFFLDEKLRQIAAYDLILKRDEAVPKWEKLILHSRKEIKATNVVSLDDWKKFSPTEGADVHKKALAKGIVIKRVFIYSKDDPEGFHKLQEMAQTQAEWGVNVRLLEGKWASNSPFIQDLLRDLGTLDVVIYDNECVLLTSVDIEGSIVSSVLTANQHRLRQSVEFFNKLWAGAKPLTEIETLASGLAP